MNVTPEIDKDLHRIAVQLIHECRLCHQSIAGQPVKVLLNGYSESGLASFRMMLVCRPCHDKDAAKVQELHSGKYPWV